MILLRCYQIAACLPPDGYSTAQTPPENCLHCRLSQLGDTHSRRTSNWELEQTVYVLERLFLLRLGNGTDCICTRTSTFPIHCVSLSDFAGPHKIIDNCFIDTGNIPQMAKAYISKLLRLRLHKWSPSICSSLQHELQFLRSPLILEMWAINCSYQQ